MDKLFSRNNLGLTLTGIGSLIINMPAFPAYAQPPKNCPPVVRSLKTKKLYCSHELKALKKAKNDHFLCLFFRAIIPPNDWIKTSQCFPRANFSSETGRKIIPKPKGTAKAFKLLQPLGSLQKSPRPLVTWQPIPQARYRISLEQGGKWLWSHETDATEIMLPADQALMSGKFYKLRVVATKDGQSISEDVTTLGLVNPQQLQQIDNVLFQAQQIDSNPLERGLDRAMMLYHLGLLDAAVAELRSLTQFQEPDVFLQLGLIFSEAGHKDIAQGYFDKASELAKGRIGQISKDS